jgi:hypothetical protein
MEESTPEHLFSLELGNACYSKGEDDVCSIQSLSAPTAFPRRGICPDGMVCEVQRLQSTGGNENRVESVCIASSLKMVCEICFAGCARLSVVGSTTVHSSPQSANGHFANVSRFHPSAFLHRFKFMTGTVSPRVSILWGSNSNRVLNFREPARICLRAVDRFGQCPFWRPSKNRSGSCFFGPEIFAR